MSKRLILCHATILALLLANLPFAQAQSFTVPERGEHRRPRTIRISAYEDDPFARTSDVRRLDAAGFLAGEDGRLLLRNDQISLSEEDFIYRKDATGEFKKFAWNPWPLSKVANQQGDFTYQDEDRFPLFRQERGADGKPLLKDGLQVWTKNDLHLGDTTAFVAASAAKDAAETWAGRDLSWGQQGKLNIEPHVFIDFNAFYSPSARELFFGVVPYRPRGETQVRMFETATSWEMVAHECGHALHVTLKPNTNYGDGFATWGESFGDQMAMWTSLRNRERVLRLIAETNGDLNRSSSLSSLAEAFAALVGTGTGMRDAFNEKKVSDTSDEVHDRSEVLTGAAYKFFLAVYDDLKCEHSAEEALQLAGQVMGVFLTHTTDFVPENQMTLDDVAKAYLKVDREFFGGRYYQVLVDEFTRREIFNAKSASEWLTHEEAIPQLHLRRGSSDEMIGQMVQAGLDELGIGPDFGLKVQSVIRSPRPGRAFSFGQTIVRVQLTQGRGEGATPLDNHGILVFRADGTLADYHAPLPQQHASLLPESFAQAQAATMINQASRTGLDQHGAPLAIVRRPDGRLTVEARVMRGEGLNAHLEIFTLDNPRGERREILIPPVPPDKSLRLAEDLIR
ncbi:MAG: hypothetical protein U0Z53_22915 [Blastocatellia bacterium]